MDGFQRTIILGTLGADPKPRQINSDSRVAGFPVAINETRKNSKTGEKVTDTMWLNVEAWNNTADFACNYLKKGSSILAEGKIRIDNVKQEDGSYKTYVKFVADSIKIVSSPDGAHNQSNENQHANQQQGSQNGQYVGVGPQGQQPVHQGGHQQPQAQQNGYGQGYQQPMQPQAPQNEHQQPQVSQQRPNQGNVESNVNNYMGGDNYAFKADDDLPF